MQRQAIKQSQIDAKAGILTPCGKHFRKSSQQDTGRSKPGLCRTRFQAPPTLCVQASPAMYKAWLSQGTWILRQRQVRWWRREGEAPGPIGLGTSIGARRGGRIVR